MPLRPHDAEALAVGLRQLFADAETPILEALTRAVIKGAETDDLERRLDVQRRLVRDMDRIIRDLRKGLPAAVNRLVRMAYGQGSAIAAADLKAAGLLASPAATFGMVQDTAAQVVLLRSAMEPLDSMTLQVRRRVLDVYAQAGLQAAGERLTGSMTRQEASRRLLQRLAGDGIKGFTDRAGRSWEMGAYAEMVGRTTAGNATIEGHMQRLRAHGVDTVMVSNAPEECKLCRPFEGRVLSIDGRTTGRLKDGRTVLCTVAEARADGLFHPNCRHRLRVYLPGATKGPDRDTADPEGDRLRQEQRARERRVRALKRRAVFAEGVDSPQAKAARKKAREAAAEHRAWLADNDRKDLAYRLNISHR